MKSNQIFTLLETCNKFTGLPFFHPNDSICSTLISVNIFDMCHIRESMLISFRLLNPNTRASTRYWCWLHLRFHCELECYSLIMDWCMIVWEMSLLLLRYSMSNPKTWSKKVNYIDCNVSVPFFFINWIDFYWYMIDILLSGRAFLIVEMCVCSVYTVHCTHCAICITAYSVFGWSISIT